ncbi:MULTISPECIES: MarR family winged helix-turn-helix transcriptional regulator [Citricoccus]|uniref:MarR family winged helix-turn-helix transcriptional regulator n=1 Tax=Citricoccus TaxID=169133 RepID=UPI000255DEBF|nr:MarR family winged helix-turn-helix transcriptional regulator [Citricoccus sp. CH26A]
MTTTTPTGLDHTATGTDATTGAAGVDRLRSTRLAHQIQFLTARARSRGTGHANTLLKAELGLKVSHFSVLSVAAHGTNPTQRELSEFLDLDPSQVVALVDVLEQRGLVERLTDPKDRRSRMIAVTDEGHRVEQLGHELTEASDQEVLAKLSAAEREQLRELLTRIAF